MHELVSVCNRGGQFSANVNSPFFSSNTTFPESNECCGHSYGAQDASLLPQVLSLNRLSNSRKINKNKKLNTNVVDLGHDFLPAKAFVILWGGRAADIQC